MAFSFATLPVLASLLAGSYVDLKKRKVKDKVWLYGAVGALLIATIQFSLGYAATMVGQAITIGFIALLFKLVTEFGLADVFALALAGMAFPEVWSLRLMAWLVLPMWFWLKGYSIVKRSDTAPAVPGILLGFVFAMITFQTF